MSDIREDLGDQREDHGGLRVDLVTKGKALVTWFIISVIGKDAGMML